MTTQPKITTVVPWFGSNRMNAREPGELLAGCHWVGVPFAGGMSELMHIDAKGIVVSDLHSHVINLARVIQDDFLRKLLVGRLIRAAFHEQEHKQAQQRCRQREEDPPSESPIPSVPWAYDFFVSSWMGRSHITGGKYQFTGNISTRWNANGGDSNTRYRSAVKSLAAWGRIMRRCNFRVMDCFDFLDRVSDEKGHGLYCDPPFPDTGDEYFHNSGKTKSEQRAWHEKLASAVDRFQSARVVMRFYDHPLVRDLYPETRWTWQCFAGRKQSNGKADEVLLCNVANERGLFD